jgi:hypothetical protein
VEPAVLFMFTIPWQNVRSDHFNSTTSRKSWWMSQAPENRTNWSTLEYTPYAGADRMLLHYNWKINNRKIEIISLW